MVSLLGGRAAEEIFFGKDHITTGASNDFERVTKIATDMIVKYGMDDELGQVVYLNKDSGEYEMFKHYSEKTAEMIDAKVKALIADAYIKSKKILNDNKDIIEKLAAVLYEKEYLTKEEFESVMKNPDQADELTQKMLEEYRGELKKVESKGV